MSTRGGFAVAYAVLAWLLCCAAMSPAWGQLGGVHARSAAGLDLTIDMTWVGDGGHRPVRVTALPTLAPTRDRELTIQVGYQTQFQGFARLSATQSIVIPANSTLPTEALIDVPMQAMGHLTQVEVFERGRLISGLSIGNAGGWHNWQDETLPNLLFVGTGYDTSSLFTIFQDRAINARFVNGVAQAAYPAAVFLSENKLPEVWHEYSSLDMVLMSLAQWKSLETNHPRRAAAIRQWTASGGNLLIYGLEDNWQQLPELERSLWPGAPTEGEPVARGWRTPDWRHRSLPVVNTSGYNTTAQPKVADGASPPGAPVAGFVSRELGWGNVVALASANPFPGEPLYWAWIFNHLQDGLRLRGRADWEERMGFHPWHDNSVQRDEFSIEGVGRPPVGAFRLLVTLFAIFIGPVNYIWLRRRGKLHLLLFIVPASALAATGSLFGFAMVSDGFGVQVRSRSVTHIDQTRNEARSWRRNIYYAGLRPSGMIFPSDTLVLPIDSNTRQATSFQRSVVWSAGEQQLQGYLNARTLTPFLLGRCNRTTHELVVHESTGTTGTARVENRLGTKIHWLMLVDSQGRCSVAQDIADQATTETTPEELAASLAESTLRIKRTPSPTRTRAWTSTPYNQQYETVLVDQWLSALESLRPTEIRPRWYLAIVADCPEIGTGLPRVDEKDSLHVVTGHW